MTMYVGKQEKRLEHLWSIAHCYLYVHEKRIIITPQSLESLW
jgi:hypothetical protein